MRVRDALGLRDNDALWLVLLALHHQRREFEASMDRRLEKAQETTEAIVASARARFLQEFPSTLKGTARKVAVRALGHGGPAVLTGLIAGLALLMVGIGSVGWLAYDLGKSAGYEQGVLAQQAATPPASKPPAAPVKRR